MDFANTADWHASEWPTEHLVYYGDLVQWAREKGILTIEEAETALRAAEANPTKAAAVLRRALELREAVYRVFAAIANNRAPTASDLQALNVALRQYSPQLQIVVSGKGFAWDWHGGRGRLDVMLAVVVQSAATLLTSEALDRVGQCADDRGCGWLFFDTSRNRSRRWCSMDDCGNRAKAMGHYRRQRAEEE